MADARRAGNAAPAWWAPELLLARLLGARGLDFDAAGALAQAAAKSPGAATPCPVLEAQRREAEERRQLPREESLSAALAPAGATSTPGSTAIARAARPTRRSRFCGARSGSIPIATI